MLSIINWKIILVSLVIGFVLGIWLGVKVTATTEKVQSHKEVKQEAQQAKQAIKELDDSEQKAKVITVEVPKIVERKIYHNICIDNDGLDVLRKLKESHQ